MLAASGSSSATVINAVATSGLAPAGSNPSDEIEGFNEHVWYDFDAMQAVARAIQQALASADPAGASEYSTNEQAFSTKLDALSQREKDLAAAHTGEGAAITEPVPLYMLQACGLVNKTPGDFSEAIEEGTDVAPAALQQTLDLFTNHEVALLAYNEQTSSNETQEVQQAAQAADIAVVPVTETLPAGDDYLGWMSANLDAVSAALGS